MSDARTHCERIADTIIASLVTQPGTVASGATIAPDHARVFVTLQHGLGQRAITIDVRQSS